MTTQLRDYRIAAGELDRFVAEWRDGILPLRRSLGFTVDGAWRVEDGNRFVWLLSFPGDWEHFAAADGAYHASPQRAALDPNPARLIEAQTTSALDEVRL